MGKRLLRQDYFVLILNLKLMLILIFSRFRLRLALKYESKLFFYKSYIATSYTLYVSWL